MKTLAILLATLGVMDSGLEANVSLPNTELVIIDKGVKAPQARSELDNSHGLTTLKMIRRTSDKVPLEIYYASPFTTVARGGSYMRVDWDRAMKDLEVMHSKGVKIVCTTFVTNEAAASKQFVDKATSLGMTIVASLGNGELTMPYPAMHPETIAVLRSDHKDKPIAAYADYIETGNGERRGGKVVVGSSFAAARVCGKLASGNNN